MRKKLFTLSLVSALVVVLLLSTVSLATPVTLENAEKIHGDAIVVDTHNDTMMHVINSRWVDPEDDSDWLPYLCLNQDLTGVTRYGHIDIPKLIEGGIDVPFFAAFVAERFYPDRVLDRTLALMNALYWQVDRNQEIMQLAGSYKDIKDIVNDDKIAAVLTIEGADSIRQPYGLELLRQYHDLGVMCIGLTWNDSNELAEGLSSTFADGSPSPPGLTEFGEEIVKEMNRLGIVVDVSHNHDNTFWDLIEVSEAPIIASHSCAYALQPVARNLKDDMIIALAENGGIIHITFVRGFLGGDMNVSRIVDHIDHVVNLVGVDYVGLGSDFDGATMPVDLADASQYPKITEELVRRGYSKAEIEKILGRNTLRVIKEAEKIGRIMRAKAGEIPGGSGQAPTITPFLEMGEIIHDSTPLLAAMVERDLGSRLDQSSFRIVLDGKPYIPDFDPSTSVVSLQVADPLSKGFHVVTFEATNHAGKIDRSTLIFHVQH